MLWDLYLFINVFACPNIATGCEFHHTTLRSDGKTPWMKRSINEVPCKMSTAKCGAEPNHMQVHNYLWRRCRRINLSNVSGFFCSGIECCKAFALYAVGAIFRKHWRPDYVHANFFIKKTVCNVRDGGGCSIWDTMLVCWLGCKSDVRMLHWEGEWFR